MQHVRSLAIDFKYRAGDVIWEQKLAGHGPPSMCGPGHGKMACLVELVYTQNVSLEEATW